MSSPATRLHEQTRDITETELNGLSLTTSTHLRHYITKAEERLSKEGKLVARTVPAGSILVTCIAGSPSCIGNAAITDREVAFNQQINALVPKQADFRFLFANIIVGKRLIQEASTAGMKGMVSKSRFEKIRLMYPPLDLQRTFAAVFDKIEDLKAAQRSSLEKLDELLQLSAASRLPGRAVTLSVGAASYGRRSLRRRPAAAMGSGRETDKARGWSLPRRSGLGYGGRELLPQRQSS